MSSESPRSRKRKRETRALEDHANLVRALRTRRTLDLAHHLGARQEPEQSETESVSSNASGERRNWARWPLLKGDVHVPEWCLGDEVGEIVGRFLEADREPEEPVARHQEVSGDVPMAIDALGEVPAIHEEAEQPVPNDDHSHPSDNVDEPNGELDDDDHSFTSSALPLPPDVLRDVTESTHIYLTRLLRTLALARPAVHSILTRRLAPLDWVSVLEMAGAHGLADIETIGHVRQVMQDIHGPRQLRVVERLRSLEARRAQLRDFATAHDEVENEPAMPRRPAAGEDETSEEEEVEEVDAFSDDDEEDRPIRSREVISDSEESGLTDRNSPPLKSRGVGDDSDNAFPAVLLGQRQATDRLSRTSSAVGSMHSDNDENIIIAPARPRELKRRVSARLARGASRTTGDAESSQATTPAPTPSAPASAEDEDEPWDADDPLMLGWRRPAFEVDDAFTVPRAARPKRREKSTAQRRSLSRARSRDT